MNYINYGDPVGNFAGDSPYSNALGTTNQHVGSVQYIGNQADGQALTDTATNLNNPVPGTDGSSSFFYGLGYAIGGIKFHDLNLYSTTLTGTPLQQLSMLDTDTSNAFAVLESLDGPLGVSGMRTSRARSSSATGSIRPLSTSSNIRPASTA